MRSTENEEEIGKIKAEHEAHLILVENARSKFKEDTKCAEECPTKETLTFDLQKTLPLPRIPTNVVY